MSAMTRVIKDFCERTGSKFIGYNNGFYEFEMLIGNIKGYTQSDLTKIVREF